MNKKYILLFCFGPGLLALYGCGFIHRLQSRNIMGEYRSVTDFSRDVVSMNGTKQTMLYKNGRTELLKFKANHHFAKKIHFASERVADKTLKGSWKMNGLDIIEVRFAGNMPSEYYQLQPMGQTLIKLDSEKKRLDKQYAPYFTFYRTGIPVKNK